MERSKNLIKLVAVLALMTTGSAAHAVAITLNGGAPAGDGSVNYAFGPLNLSNANVDAETDSLAITKDFLDLSGVSFGGTFDSSASGQAIAVTESITNSSESMSAFGFSGGDWLDYHIEIAFTLSTACLSLGTQCTDSVAASGVSNSAFANAAVTSASTATGGTIMIDFTGGTVAELGGGFDIDFQLDVIADSGSIDFTITQFPTTDGGLMNTPMPEPTTLALLGLGLAGLGAGRRKKA